MAPDSSTALVSSAGMVGSAHLQRSGAQTTWVGERQGEWSTRRGEQRKKEGGNQEECTRKE